MNDTDYAWAAGFFDGEGHIAYKRGARKSDPQRYTWKNIILEIAQKDRRVLDKFLAIVEVGAIYGPYRNGASAKNAPHSAYRYACSSFYAIKRVVELLWPYLGEIKRLQAQVAIDGWIAEPRLRVGRKPGTKLVP